jgi:hypothetical protein
VPLRKGAGASRPDNGDARRDDAIGSAPLSQPDILSQGGPPPDLQEWVEAAGGYHKIDWAKWDAAVSVWRQTRLDVLAHERAESVRGGRKAQR